MGDAFHIVGGGPAGAGAAVAASRMGFKPVVYEAMSELALKPCGRGIPVVGDLPVKVPGESVLNRIRSAVMYVDGDFLFELKNVFEGYIVDKRLMLEAIITSHGGEIVYKARFDPMRGVVKARGAEVRPGLGVFAGGHLYYDKAKVPVVQWLLKTDEYPDDTLYIFFDTEILGYYYIFPHGERTVEVGVGGHKSFGELKRALETFIRGDNALRAAERVRLEGAMVSLGGLSLGYLGGLVKAGESAGFVLPLTGEGIRPSMLSGYVAASALIEGRDPIKALHDSSMARAIRVQRRILDLVSKLGARQRAELLRSLTPRAHAEIALGRMDSLVLARELSRAPGLLVKMLRLISQA